MLCNRCKWTNISRGTNYFSHLEFVNCRWDKKEIPSLVVPAYQEPNMNSGEWKKNPAETCIYIKTLVKLFVFYAPGTRRYPAWLSECVSFITNLQIFPIKSPANVKWNFKKKVASMWPLEEAGGHQEKNGFGESLWGTDGGKHSTRFRWASLRSGFRFSKRLKNKTTSIRRSNSTADRRKLFPIRRFPVNLGFPYSSLCALKAFMERRKCSAALDETGGTAVIQRDGEQMER